VISLVTNPFRGGPNPSSSRATVGSSNAGRAAMRSIVDRAPSFAFAAFAFARLAFARSRRRALARRSVASPRAALGRRASRSGVVAKT
jgi:hypothetical protein